MKDMPLTKQKFDAFDAIAQFRLQVLDQKPSIQQMKKDILMKHLQIRPYVGDVFSLNMSNHEFIDALWSIIKLDEFVELAARKLPRREAMTFINMSNQFRERFQQTINQVDMRLPHMKKEPDQPIAIEIFKSRLQKKRVH